MFKIGLRFDVRSGFNEAAGRWEHEHKRVINGKLYLFLRYEYEDGPCRPRRSRIHVHTAWGSGFDQTRVLYFTETKE